MSERVYARFLGDARERRKSQETKAKRCTLDGGVDSEETMD